MAHNTTRAIESPSRALHSSVTLDAHSDGDGCAAHAQPPRAPTPGAFATTLDEAGVAKATKITISAREGSALLRKHGNAWMSAGKRGCVVPDARVSAALASLAKLSVAKRHSDWPRNTEFELQIDVLDGEDHLLHLEVGPRIGGTDLVKLLNDDVVELTGIDRRLLSAAPEAWCLPP